MKIFGAGLGRTGTMSMRVALNQLGLGPCHHMKLVLDNMPEHVPLWNAVLDGNPDWSAVYAGQNSAVDWPTASFFKELHVAFPDAKFILTERNPLTWADSISETILTALASRDQMPEEVQKWMNMCLRVLSQAGVEEGMSRDELASVFTRHNELVKASIAPAQLLVYQVKEGWEPLCKFLSLEVPNETFPRTNDREEFFKLVNEGVSDA